MRRFLENIKENFFAEQERWVIWVSVLFALGIGLYFSLSFEPNKWLTVVAVELLLVLCYVWRHYPLRLLCLSALLIMAAGFSDIQVQTLYQSKHIQYPQNNNEVTYLKGRILSVGKNTKGKVRLLLADAADFENSRKGLFRVTLSSKSTSLQDGQCVEMVATLMKPSAPALPDGYQFDRKAFFEGISAVGYANSSVFVIDCESKPSISQWVSYLIDEMRSRIVDRINRELEPDEAGIVAAIVAGERGGISAAITDNYRNSGLAHFLSISGLHMSMIAAMAFFFVRLIIALIPPLALRYNSKKIAAVFAIFMSLVYLLISGAEIPAQRAFISTFIVLLGVLFARQAISMRMVSFAALVVLAISPQALVSASFQMSFAAVVVLIAFYERYAKPIQHFFAGSGFIKIVIAYMGGLLISDFVASLATLPFSIYHFNQVAIYTTLGNMLAGPIIGLIIMPFVLAALFLMPLGLDVIPLKIVGFGVMMVNEITAYVAHLPHAGYKIMSMPFWGLMLMVFGGLWLCIWQRSWRKWGIVPIVIGILSIFTVQKPDVLYDTTAKTIAFKDNEGNMVAMPGRANNWIKQIWLEKTVSMPIEKAEQKELKKIVKGDKTDLDWIDLQCKPNECIYKNVVRWNKKDKLYINDKLVDTQSGDGGAIFMENGKIIIKSVREGIGYRPWNEKNV